MHVRGTGTLYQPQYRTRGGEKRTSGVYWWKCGRVRVSTGMRTEEDAQHWVLERLVEMRRGHLVGLKAHVVKWDDLERMLCDRWEADGRKSLPQILCRLRFLRRAWAGWRAQDITPDQITAYALKRRREGAAIATVNVELALLHRAFAVAREAGRLDVIPVIRRLPGEGHRTGTVEGGDFDAILGAMPARYHGALRFLYATGWREKEALTLTWQHVDLGAGEVRLAAENSKTRAPRLLSFPPESGLAQLLEAQWKARSFGPYVFPGRAGRALDRTALQKAWRRACVSVGLPGALIHDLRRTAARDLRRAGVSLAVAMGALGHRDLGVHQGYSVVASDDQRDAVSRLEALRAGEPVQRRLVAIR